MGDGNDPVTMDYGVYEFKQCGDCGNLEDHWSNELFEWETMDWYSYYYYKHQGSRVGLERMHEQEEQQRRHSLVIIIMMRMARLKSHSMEQVSVVHIQSSLSI